MAETGSPQRTSSGRLKRLARAITSDTWGERAARVGLGARGVVYVVLAYLVARIALGALGEPGTDKPASGPGVAQELAAQPGGRAVVLVLGLGLLLYAMFSALDAVLHHDDESPKAKRWADRGLSLWGVVVYGGFAVYCFTVVASSHAGQKTSGQSSTQQTRLTATVLSWPTGRVWLALLGVVLLVIAAFLVSRCARLSFRPRLEREEMSTATWRTAMVLGVLGYLGRAGLFTAVGWFVLSAAIEDDPAKGQGVDGSLRALAASPAGPGLLWALAGALLGYGLYMGVEARHRRV